MDRKPEFIDGEVSETESSDSRVEAKYIESRNQVFGTRGKILELTPKDLYAPKSTVPQPLDDILEETSKSEPTQIKKSLQHNQSLRGLQIRNLRVGNLRKKAA